MPQSTPPAASSTAPSSAQKATSTTRRRRGGPSTRVIAPRRASHYVARHAHSSATASAPSVSLKRCHFAVTV